MQLNKHNYILARNSQIVRGICPNVLNPDKVGDRNAMMNRRSIEKNTNQKSFLNK